MSADSFLNRYIGLFHTNNPDVRFASSLLRALTTGTWIFTSCLLVFYPVVRSVHSSNSLFTCLKAVFPGITLVVCLYCTKLISQSTCEFILLCRTFIAPQEISYSVGFYQFLRHLKSSVLSKFRLGPAACVCPGRLLSENCMLRL